MKRHIVRAGWSFGLSLALTALLGASLMPPAAWAQQAKNTAIEPVSRPDEWWQKRQKEKNERVKQGHVDLIYVGDSIIHGWEGRGKKVWDEYYGDRNAVNLGFGGDRTQHVLWRLDHGNVDGISPKLAIVMIGTNNYKDNTAEEIGQGIIKVVQKLREKLPKTKVLLLAIFPRGAKPSADREKLAKASLIASKIADNKMIYYMDIGRYFLEPDGTLSKTIFPDLLHPNEKGYEIWANAVEPKVALLMGDIAKGEAPKGFVKLFDGKDLVGWKGLVGNPETRAKMSQEELAKAQAKADQEMRDHWKVKHDTLVFDGKGKALCTARDYEDFEMLVDWKIEKGGDSGIYLRGTPQVQIWDTAQWPQGSGGLYNNKIGRSDPLVCADNPTGTWNHFRIKMIGDKVTVYLNDKLVVDNETMENYWNRDKPIYPSGQIELQNHGSTLMFKNLFIREIPRGDGWVSLFNGKDLTGWEQVGGKKQVWHVKNGLLYTSGKEGGWLSTTKEYSDFDLSLEFRVPPGGNSGVFIRTPREGNPAYAGSEIQVLDDYANEYKHLHPWQYCGSVYHTIAPSRRWSLPAGTWEKMQIHVQGSKVKVALNCHPIIDGDLNDHLDLLKDHPGLKRTSGYIGLQNHGTRLDYRNIRIRELKSDK